MPAAISCQSLTKSFSARPLFDGITLTVDERDRVGMIGPNGAGKSTLLKIMAGLLDPDEGTVTTRRFLNVAYLAQDNRYDARSTLRDVVTRSLEGVPMDEPTRRARVEVELTRVGLSDFDALAGDLSGGWRKRLAIAAELVKEPDVLLLDEPTNHLDLEGVLWLEELLKSAPFAFVLVSHDRSFLENVSNRTVELNPFYRDGYLSVKGPYSELLRARQEYTVAQANEEQALASKVRREIAWLARGARARQTKAQSRIREAGKLIDDLDEVKSRNNQTASVAIDFNASGRKTKELLVGKGIEKSLGGRLLFSGLDLTLTPGEKVGLMGTNGSGKTTLLRILAGQLEPDRGAIKRAQDLKVVWFDQNRDQLDQKMLLRQALCPSGDSVVYRGRSIHVASWARRFLFRPDQLNMAVSYLSGGEQARILIARLMLQEADVLILDEPTNDLDIPSLEVLEESLSEFPGALVLVTHDRFMLDNISTTLLALDGRGGTAYFADYAQWEERGRFGEAKGAGAFGAVRAAASAAPATIPAADRATSPAVAAADLKPLSTAEKKEILVIGAKVEAAEAAVASIKVRMIDPAIACDHVKLGACTRELSEAEAAVERLYARWQNLESRQVGAQEQS